MKWLVFALALPLIDVAYAGSYICTDSAGHTHAGHEPPPECKDQEVKELNPDGSLKRTMPAPMTQKQREEKKEAEEKQRQKEANEKAQKDSDRALREKYRSVAQIEARRERTLEPYQARMDQAELDVRQLQKEHQHLDDEKEFYLRHEVPEWITRGLKFNEELTRQEQKSKAETFEQMRSINEGFDAQKRRFLEITE